uniref:Uncharacterized protein n=1 Tax=Tanacetum cinerariifolium TaxID=118510 RepID=A0A699L190_TANCI|nr:hypothetical protein [Tanacetum cinerariifolium]
MVIRTDERHPSNDLALLRLHGLQGHSTFNSLGLSRLSSTIWISPLLLLASIECDIMNSTQHHIDSSISREITPTTFAQPTLLRTFWENNLNDSASVRLGLTGSDTTCHGVIVSNPRGILTPIRTSHPSRV